MTSHDWLEQFAQNRLNVSDVRVDIDQYARVLMVLLREEDPVTHVSKILAHFAQEVTGEDECRDIISFASDARDFIKEMK